MLCLRVTKIFKMSLDLKYTPLDRQIQIGTCTQVENLCSRHCINHEISSL